MRVLVTGASGMLGKALVRRLRLAHEITGLSKSGGEGTVALDLSNESAVQDYFKEKIFDWIIHSAAYSDVDGCERDPGLAHRSNALATRYLAAVCESAQAPLVYVSSDYVFSGLKNTDYREEDPTGPVNIYGMTKLSGEHYARGSAVSASVRTSWIFGEGSQTNFVNAVAGRLRNKGSADVLDDQMDRPTYATDLAEALEKIGLSLLNKKNQGWRGHEIFHVANRGVATRHEMTLAIRDFMGLGEALVGKVDPRKITGRLAVRPRRPVLCTDRFESRFGPLRHWRDSLAEYIKASHL